MPKNRCKKPRRQAPTSILTYRKLFGHFSTIEAIITDTILASPDQSGCIREEISDISGVPLASVCGRCTPMIRERKILAIKLGPDGKPDYRLTKAGFPAEILIINPGLTLEEIQ